MEIFHTFVVCAYKESPYLEECLKSLMAQTANVKIIISTSTPNDVIASVAKKYGIEVFVNEGEAGITGDWNFARSLAGTPLVTIAHQDDVYEPMYAETVAARMKKARKPIIAFTNYFELRGDERVYKNRLLRIKRLMNVGYKLFPRWKWMRLRVLSLGNSICCPSVTYSTDICRDEPFDNRFKFVCDWDEFDRLARKKGTFVYIGKPLMGHRIHGESETTNLTASGRRAEEEFTMFRRYWSEGIARKLSGVYAKGADSNEL